MIEVVCGVLIRDGQCLIASRKTGPHQGTFEFPGGKVEAGETKEDALRREWQEECGIPIEKIRFLKESTDVQQDVALTCFTCSAKEKPTCHPVHSRLIWTTPDHIYDYPFFEADRVLVDALQEQWSALLEIYS